MKAYIQVVGQHTPDGLPTLVLHYDTQRYVFNVREGTQRLCVQEKVKLAKANQIFLTRTNWDCVGGLTGLLLTLTDAGMQKIHLHGTKNLTHFIAATRRFVFRTSSSIEIDEMDDNSVYKDKNLTIKPVIVLPNEGGTKRTFDETLETHAEESVYHNNGQVDIQRMVGKEASDYRKSVVDSMYTNRNQKKGPDTAINAECTPRKEYPLKRGTGINHTKLPLPWTEPYPAAISYICQGATIPGRFKKEVALALGIRPGPIYGRLHKGETVTLEDGRVVTQDMVCEPAKPGHTFVIIDCPTTEHMERLIESDKFRGLQTGGEYQADVIFHFLGPSIIESDVYKKWVALFGDKTEHVFSSVKLCPQDVQFSSHALCQVKLAKMNQTIFPIPYYDNQPEMKLSDNIGLPEKSVALKSLATYTLEPTRFWKYNERLEFDHTNKEHPDIKAIEDNTEYLQAAELARSEADKVDISQEFPGNDVEVITLGTGSSIPAKYRNVSATMVKIPKYGTIMLDAGEGTYGQMMRRFNNQEINQEIKKIECIFVSHLHADHHLGVIQLIKQWFKVSPKESTLTLIAPRVYKFWVDEYFQVEMLGERKRVEFLSSEHIQSKNDYYIKGLKQVKEKLGLSVIQPIEVDHCKWAYGISIEHKDGWKLVYSGDTRPCNNLIEEGRNATLLIHEATFDDTEQQNAIDKKHTTTGEAIEVGQKMHARYTLLNHFSQRYPKIPSLSDQQSNVCFSFDLMSTLIKQIPLLPKYTEAMRLVFKDSEDPEDEQVIIK